MYDPTVGVWLTEDPIRLDGGDVNYHRYVGNSPTNATDPSGLILITGPASGRDIQAYLHGTEVSGGLADLRLPCGKKLGSISPDDAVEVLSRQLSSGNRLLTIAPWDVQKAKDVLARLVKSTSQDPQQREAQAFQRKLLNALMSPAGYNSNPGDPANQYNIPPGESSNPWDFYATAYWERSLESNRMRGYYQEKGDQSKPKEDWWFILEPVSKDDVAKSSVMATDYTEAQYLLQQLEPMNRLFELASEFVTKRVAQQGLEGAKWSYGQSIQDLYRLQPNCKYSVYKGQGSKPLSPDIVKNLLAALQNAKTVNDLVKVAARLEDVANNTMSPSQWSVWKYRSEARHSLKAGNQGLTADQFEALMVKDDEANKQAAKRALEQEAARQSPGYAEIGAYEPTEFQRWLEEYLNDRGISDYQRAQRRHLVDLAYGRCIEPPWWMQWLGMPSDENPGTLMLGLGAMAGITSGYQGYQAMRAPYSYQPTRPGMAWGAPTEPLSASNRGQLPNAAAVQGLGPRGMNLLYNRPTGTGLQGSNGRAPLVGPGGVPLRLTIPEYQRLSLELLDVTTCFVAGTPLLTPDGDKVIEAFKPGDYLLSRPDHDVNAQIELSVVEEVFVSAAAVIMLRVRGRDIWTSEEHPFYVRGEGWLTAKELQVGHELSSDDGQWVVVEKLGEAREIVPVHNLRVAHYHTYFVGSREWGFSVWAHNLCYKQWLAKHGLKHSPGLEALFKTALNRNLTPESEQQLHDLLQDKGIQQINRAWKDLQTVERESLPVGRALTKDDLPLLKRYLEEEGGRWGGKATRELNHALASRYEDQGWTVRGGAGRYSEEHVVGPKGEAYPDITLTKDGKTLRIQTATMNADGTLEESEMTKADKILAARPNDKLIIISKVTAKVVKYP
jgi:hypothetical protein